MQAHGWHSAEVVSSHSHLPRASLIFAHFPIAWRMHAAPWPPQYGWFRGHAIEWYEAADTARLRITSFPESRFLAGSLTRFAAPSPSPGDRRSVV